MKNKNLIRSIVLAGIVAWPTVEYTRYRQAVRQLEASIQLQTSVAVKLASLKSTQVASKSPNRPSAKP